MNKYNVYVTQDEEGNVTGVFGSRKAAEKNPFNACTKHELQRDVMKPRINTVVEEAEEPVVDGNN